MLHWGLRFTLHCYAPIPQPALLHPLYPPLHPGPDVLHHPPQSTPCNPPHFLLPITPATCLALITDPPLWDCDGCRGLDLSPWFPKETSALFWAQLLPLPAEWWKRAGSERSAHHSPICLEQRLLKWCLPWLLHHAAAKCSAHQRICTGIKWSDKYALIVVNKPVF